MYKGLSCQSVGEMYYLKQKYFISLGCLALVKLERILARFAHFPKFLVLGSGTVQLGKAKLIHVLWNHML